MTLHVRDRWNELFLTLPGGEVIFLKQNGNHVHQLMTRQDPASAPASSQPIRFTFINATVRKRVEEILSENGKILKIIPIGTTLEQVAIPN